MSSERFSTDAVRRYYDAGTPAFERWGQGASAGVVRRAVWAPGVQSRQAAFEYVDEQIDAELPALERRSELPLRVIDFGCGVAGTLTFLAKRRALSGLGVTISPVQARLARERIAAAGLAECIACCEADFLSLPAESAPAQLVLSIEAFVHSASPDAYFAAVARQLAPGGLAIVCDDFLTERALGPLSKRQARCVEEFRHGWLAPSLVSVATADAAAQRAGFVLERDNDLTPYLELGRPRDRALALLIALARPLRLRTDNNRWRSLVGGNALQWGLQAGLIEYRYLVWRRSAAHLKISR